MKHCMIDIETLGSQPGSVVVSIGAAMFEPLGEELGEEFYVNVDEESSKELGLTVDDSTLQWWGRQSEEARNALLHPPPKPCAVAFLEFREWFRAQKAEFAWGHGATFDVVLLERVFAKLPFAPPWRWWNARDTRTVFGQVKEIAKIRHGGGWKDAIPRLEREGTYHNALDDARYQVRQMQAAHEFLFEGDH